MLGNLYLMGSPTFPEIPPVSPLIPQRFSQHFFEVSLNEINQDAVRVGRLLGVDSVLIYFIQGPTLRDRMFVKNPENVSPVMVTSKIIRVESAEVLFHNVVTAPIVGQGMGAGAVFSRQSSLRPLVREALERAVTQTISDLTHAFR